MITIKEAVEVVTSEIRNDEGYRISWKSSLAMAFQDQTIHYCKVNKKSLPDLTFTDIYEIANQAADAFLDLLCSQIDKNGESEKAPNE